MLRQCPCGQLLLCHKCITQSKAPPEECHECGSSQNLKPLNRITAKLVSLVEIPCGNKGCALPVKLEHMNQH